MGMRKIGIDSLNFYDGYKTSDTFYKTLSKLPLEGTEMFMKIILSVKGHGKIRLLDLVDNNVLIEVEFNELNDNYFEFNQFVEIKNRGLVALDVKAIDMDIALYFVKFA
jgi:hypothetical protein